MLADGGLTFRNARGHVRDFAFEGQELVAQHSDAMDCRDCEAFLQMGIDAFHWILRADIALRTAEADGKLVYTEELVRAIESLAISWLQPCELAERLIKIQQDRNVHPENLEEFRKCCEEMRAIVKFNETWRDESLPPGLIPLRDQALREFRNGETAEFFPDTEPNVP